MGRYQITFNSSRVNGSVTSSNVTWSVDATSEQEALDKFYRAHAGSIKYEIINVKKIR